MLMASLWQVLQLIKPGNRVNNHAQFDRVRPRIKQGVAIQRVYPQFTAQIFALFTQQAVLAGEVAESGVCLNRYAGRITRVAVQPAGAVQRINPRLVVVCIHMSNQSFDHTLWGSVTGNSQQPVNDHCASINVRQGHVGFKFHGLNTVCQSPQYSLHAVFRASFSIAYLQKVDLQAFAF